MTVREYLPMFAFRSLPSCLVGEWFRTKFVQDPPSICWDALSGMPKSGAKQKKDRVENTAMMGLEYALNKYHPTKAGSLNAREKIPKVDSMVLPAVTLIG